MTQKRRKASSKRPIPEGQCRKLPNGAYVCKCRGKPIFTKTKSCPKG
jgi:hypothetical protein